MKTWDDYKEHAKSSNPNSKREIEEMEALAQIISAMIEQRKELGLSQRDLAAMCGIPQSSVARIESYKTTPNIETLLKIFKSLGLSLTVSKI